VYQLNSPRSLRQCALRLPKATGWNSILQDEINHPRDLYELAIARKLNISLAAYQQLLGDLRGLEVGSLPS
jgi:hypothetical protein